MSEDYFKALEELLKKAQELAKTRDEKIKSEIFEKDIELNNLIGGKLVKLGISKTTSYKTHAEVLEYLKLLIAGVKSFLESYEKKGDLI